MSRFAGRQLDQLWFYFFATHIPIALTMDLQALYPSHWLAKTPLPGFLKWYTTVSRDPIILGCLSSAPEWSWMRSFLWCEMLFQLPVWIIGVFAMWNNDKRVYPLLLAYGASTATILVPMLNALVYTKVVPPLTPIELGSLLACYVPYFVFPLGIAVDMGMRLGKLINQTQARKQA